jgi:hypothetical protein
MAWHGDVGKLRYRLKQMREQMGALEREVGPLLELTDGLARRCAELQTELERLQGLRTSEDGRSVRGEWVGPDELRAEVEKADAWRRMYDAEALRVSALERDKANGAWASGQELERLRRERDQLQTLAYDLLVERVEKDGCGLEREGLCDGGWIWLTCGEDTCQDLRPCSECNLLGIRVSWDQRMGMDEDGSDD